MYKNLKKVGIRDIYNTPISDPFTPEEYKSHFEKVSALRHENDVTTLREAIGSIDTHTMLPHEMQEAAIVLDKPWTKREVLSEIDKIKEGAPGIDNTRICYIKKAGRQARDELAKIIIKMAEQPAHLWEEITKPGLMVPLFKKGERKDMNNYRGVCLLPMCSRIIARVMASRLRKWAETIGALDENQNGFRQARSTADTTQMIIRINEEVERKGLNVTASDTPVATLLDITKAYPG